MSSGVYGVPIVSPTLPENRPCKFAWHAPRTIGPLRLGSRMPDLETKAVLVPVELVAGDQFKVSTEWGATFTIAVPEGSTGGDIIAVDLPTFESVASEIDEIEGVRVFVDALASSRAIERFLHEHAGAFGEEAGAPVTDGEFPLHYTAIHAEYVALVESLLEEFLAAQGLDSQTFVQLVQRSGSDSRARLLRAIDGMSDFEQFVQLMRDEATEATGSMDTGAAAEPAPTNAGLPSASEPATAVA